MFGSRLIWREVALDTHTVSPTMTIGPRIRGIIRGRITARKSWLGIGILRLRDGFNICKS